VISISKVVLSFGYISVIQLHVSDHIVPVKVISAQSNVLVCIGSENVAINFTEVHEVGLCCIVHVFIVTWGLLVSNIQSETGQYQIELLPVRFPVSATAAKNQLLRIPSLIHAYLIFL
jgi:hypothetical protein